MLTLYHFFKSALGALLQLPARSLFADQNKNPRRQRNKIEEQNGRAEINAKTHETINNEENRG
jgi:hypothetical protein